VTSKALKIGPFLSSRRDRNKAPVDQNSASWPGICGPGSRFRPR
jgi:hypothetical protein